MVLSLQLRLLSQLQIRKSTHIHERPISVLELSLWPRQKMHSTKSAYDRGEWGHQTIQRFQVVDRGHKMLLGGQVQPTELGFMGKRNCQIFVLKYGYFWIDKFFLTLNIVSLYLKYLVLWAFQRIPHVLINETGDYVLLWQPYLVFNNVIVKQHGFDTQRCVLITL